MQKPVVHLYTLCYNEEEIIPFFLQHYLPWVEKIVVLDNNSTDRSRELLEGRENVLVKSYDTGNEYREDIQMKLRNTIWHQSRGLADFVIVCDMDEFLYVKDHETFLRHLRQQGFTVVRPFGINMVSESFPQPGVPLTSQIREGVPNEQFSKMVLFDPVKIERINFFPGSHFALPEGQVKIYMGDQKVKLLHYRYLGLQHMLKKNRSRHERRGQVSMKQGWGYHYSYEEQKQQKIFEHFLQKKSRVLD
jgi:glycosyltransferase involved in cell wall biosynthesis